MIGIIVLNLTEALHDHSVIKAQDPNADPKLVNDWHRESALYYFVVSILLMIATSIILLPYALISRRVFMDIPLNLMRKKPWNYLSDRGIDGFMKKYFKNLARPIEISIFVLLTILILHTL